MSSSGSGGIGKASWGGGSSGPRSYRPRSPFRRRHYGSGYGYGYDGYGHHHGYGHDPYGHGYGYGYRPRRSSPLVLLGCGLVGVVVVLFMALFMFLL
ncbi:hypothetical protein J4H86_03875 [Spiractinospora alimapuensis]|uniref:hypothetical protein n=1 Tax=Spiractinospora alimapuensis TaxID=2820884 RepID=UPI001F36D080|nr:hypothetical protein [Spiractinospora alimapuensis]QVQ52963.1 hypothetical protein J4H86_03875 [Spiractinospora alimapuensis]